MGEQPERFDKVTASEVADAFIEAARDLDLEVTAELVATLLAQSALETGNWDWLRNYNFGHFKATDEWVAAGKDYVFFVKNPPHFRAPVSENMSAAQIAQARAVSKPRTDGVDGADMEVLGEVWPGVRSVAFWASHPQTRFRSFQTMAEGAKAYVGKFLGRYRGALEPASSGDVLAYVTALKNLGPYFTADFTQYYLGVLNRYRNFLPAARAALAGEDEVQALPNVGAFRTALEHIEVREEGWIKLPTGVELTRLPLWDRKHDLAARIGFGPVVGWLADRGMRLPTQAELDELHQLSHFVAPVTKVDDEADTEHMMSHRWCAEHDAEVWRRLHEGGWDGQQPVVNFGKHWVAPAGTIYGWWRAPAPSAWKYQGPSTWHQGEPTYADYATNVIAARDPAPSVLSSAPWGFRALVRLITYAARGVSEKTHPSLIKSWHAVAGMPWLDPVKHPWCASCQSAMAEETHQGEPWPHDKTPRVRELLSSSIRLGTAVPIAEVRKDPERYLKPGNVLLMARGSDPGPFGPNAIAKGHASRIERWAREHKGVTGLFAHGVDGNVGDAVDRRVYDLSEKRHVAVIVYPDAELLDDWQPSEAEIDAMIEAERIAGEAAA